MNIDPNVIMEIVKTILLIGGGAILGYFTFWYNVREEKTKVNRDRLLINIAKMEDYLHLTIEQSFLEKKVFEIEKIKTESEGKIFNIFAKKWLG